MSGLLNATPRRQVRLNARDYLRLTAEERTNITKVRIIPPTLGCRDFGGFEVTYRRPIFIAHGYPVR